MALIINPSPYILLNHQPSLLLLGLPLQIRRESWAIDLPNNKLRFRKINTLFFSKIFPYHEGRKVCFQPFVESLRPCLSDSSSTKKNFLVSKEEERGGGRVKGERERERCPLLLFSLFKIHATLAQPYSPQGPIFREKYKYIRRPSAVPSHKAALIFFPLPCISHKTDFFFQFLCFSHTLTQTAVLYICMHGIPPPLPPDGNIACGERKRKQAGEKKSIQSGSQKYFTAIEMLLLNVSQ